MGSLLRQMLETRRAAFTALAEAWLAGGAAAFGVFEHGRPVAIWPDGARVGAPHLLAPIAVAGAAVADLRVAGAAGLAAEARLVAEAALVRDLLMLELENRHIAGDLMRSQEHLRAVYDLADSLRRQLTLDDTLGSVAGEARRLLGAERSCVIYSPAGAAPAVVCAPGPAADEGFLLQMLGRLQAADGDLLLPGGADVALPPGVESLWLTPIRLRGRVVGALGLLNRAGGIHGGDARLAKAVADLAGGQIEAVQLYQESLGQARLSAEMELARRVQINLMPQRLPQVAGLEIAASARPALQVGGDFYDFVARPDQPMIVAVGDVSGKGISAALLMTMTRTAIRSKASFMPGPTPARVLLHSNEDLYDDFARVGMFATVFIGQYEPAAARLRYVSAGHAPVIYRPAGGPPRLLVPEATAMGVLTELSCPDATVRIGPGDLLVVGTDGLTEARSPADELFGHERLIALIEGVAGRPAPAIASAVYAAVDSFSGGRLQGDDQTLVVIRGVAP